MRLKELFTIPEGTRVTENMLAKVLISSICSILLCMACLASTTWAWFTASIENTGNVIQIASVTADVKIATADEQNITIISDSTEYNLASGTYTLTIQLKNEAKAPDYFIKSHNTVYVLMTATYENKDMPEYYYFSFDENPSKTKKIKISNNCATINFAVSWVEPASATFISDETNVIDLPLSSLSEETTPVDSSVESSADVSVSVSSIESTNTEDTEPIEETKGSA